KEWLLKHYPDRYRRVVGLVRDLREGKDNDPNYHSRMAGTGPFAWMVGRRFEIACERLKLNRTKLPLNTKLFTRPLSDEGQLTLF
ncbi:MAG: radical SAM protein, partial [Hyphomicrobiales bacterium]|nr:radical SAM protein [Hyphomicrobiales bacterium]